MEKVWPKISITIPCRNEEGYIAKCIQSILDSNYPSDRFKIFVVDGRSGDRSREIIQEFVSRFPTQVELIDNQEQTTPFALNYGLRKSGFDVKIIFGAHAAMTAMYLRECVSAFEKDPEIGCVGGPIENVYENSTAKIVGLAMSSSFGVGNATFRTGGEDGFVDTVAFGAYKQEVFDQVGYFDEDLVRNQDDEFNFRVTQGGWKVWFTNKIQSKYFVRSSFKKLFRQYYQYGYWKVFVNVKHKTVTTIRQLVPFFFVSYLLGFLLAAFFGVWFFVGYGVGLALYFLMAILFASKKSSNSKELVLLVQTFFILHFSYGLGYLLGIVNFGLMRKKPSDRSQKLSR